MNFMFSVPSRVTYGRGCSASVGTVLKNYGVEKALLVYDRGIAQAGLVDPVRQAMVQAGISVVDFDEVEPNPTDRTITKGAELARSAQVQGIVALGGGSAMDCAKGINVLQTNPGPISRYEGGDRVEKRGLLLVCIPTTSGTSSEITAVSIVTDTQNERKYIMAGRNVGADLALVDPSLMDKLPAKVTAATGIDALTHAIESYVSLGANPLTEALSLRAAGILAQNLPKAVHNPGDTQARDQMALGCVIVGCAFSNAGLGLVHAISHTLSAHYGLAHGVACSVTLPYVVAYNYPAAQEKYDALAQTVAPGTDKRLDQLILELERDLGMPTLKECGVPADRLEFLAQETMKEDFETNPNREINPEVVLKLLQQAY